MGDGDGPKQPSKIHNPSNSLPLSKNISYVPDQSPFQVYVQLTYQIISQMDLIFVNSFRSGMLFYCLEYRHLV